MIKTLGNIFLICLTSSLISACSTIGPNRYSANIKKFSFASEALAARSRQYPFLKPVRNGQVNKWIKYFTKKDRSRFQRFLRNGAKYKPHIEKILDEYKLPRELYFLGMIESGYYLHAKSRAAAVGPWQFIRGTGRQYGLKVNSEMDERRNLIKSTHAAAKYLKRLHKLFRSWELAVAAYNMGEYGLIRRISRARTRDYYRLASRRYLPRETRNYVPKILAALHVYKNARHYGFSLNAPRRHPYRNIATVTVPGNVTLRDIAKYSDTSYSTLKKLNPEFKRAHLPRRRAGHKILVPASRSTNVIRYTATHRHSPRSTPSGKSYYRVRRGDNLTKIASQFGLTIRAIKKLNNLRTSKIMINQKIKVAQASRGRKYHVVKRGDNLTEIASKYGLNLRRLKQANRISKSVIHPGQKLLVEI